MEVKKYKGFYCKKCNSIPLIQIIPQSKNIKIFSCCKCHKQYQNYDKFIKNNYITEEIDISKISKEPILNNANEEKVDINIIEDNLKKVKVKIYKEKAETKDKLIEILQKTIEEINEIYEKFVVRNNKIIFIIEEMIKSYKMLNYNQSNIKNILNNCNFDKRNYEFNLLPNQNLNSFFKDINLYFKKELIVNLFEEFDNKYSSNEEEPNAPSGLLEYKNLFDTLYDNNELYEGFNHYSLFCEKNAIKTLVEIDNNSIAYCSNDNPNIILFNYLNYQFISFKAHSTSVNWIIKTNKNYLISCGDDGLIKIWDFINEKIFRWVKKGEKINKSDINIDLNPIYIYKLENLEKIEKMISLKEKRFLAVSNKNIYIFKYNINEKDDISNNIEIKLIKQSFIDNNLVDAYIFEKNNIEIIALNTEFLLYFLDISNLGIIYKIEVNSMTKNSLIQIDKNSLLLKEKDFFKIIELNTFKIKLIVKNIYNNNSYLFNLEDGTIIQGYDDGIKRYSIKTFEELPNLIYYGGYYNPDSDISYIELFIVYMLSQMIRVYFYSIKEDIWKNVI